MLAEYGLLGAYRKVAKGSPMVTSPITSRDPMTSVSWCHIQNASSPTVLVGIRSSFEIIVYCILCLYDPRSSRPRLCDISGDVI